MRRLFTKVGSLAAVAALAFTMAQPAQADQADVPEQRVAAGSAYFEFTDYSSDTAILKLDDPAKIQQARGILSGKETSRTHVLGKIKTDGAPYNPNWSFHFDPSTVSFFDVAIEVCDATLAYVEDHLDEVGGAFLPGHYCCPWGSKLIREVPAP
ncbi:BP74-related protein [Streptomyces hypolithicus]